MLPATLTACTILACLPFLITDTDAKGLVLPHGMEQDDYCKGCISTVEAIAKKKHDGVSSKKIINKIDDLCSSLKGPKNKTTCNHLIENHNDDLEKIIAGSENLKGMITWFCHEHTFACIGIKTTHKQKEEWDEEKFQAHLKKLEHKKRVPDPVRATDEL